MDLFFGRKWSTASLYAEIWLRHASVRHSHVGDSMSLLKVMLMLILLAEAHPHAVHSCWHRHPVWGEVLRLHHLHIGVPQ